MLSVIHVCTDFWPSTGGIQKFVQELAHRSSVKGTRVTVLCLNRVKGFGDKLAAHDHLDAVAIRRIPFVDLVYYKPAFLPLSMLRSHDIIHVHGIGALLDFVGIMKWVHRRPIIVSTHGGIFHTTALGGLKRLYFDGIQRRLFRQVDIVAACSRSDADIFRRICDRVTLIENAVDVEPYLALSGERRQRGRCVYVGRLSDNKGIDLLLRAAHVARQRGAEFQLRLVGPDVDGKRERFQSLADALDLHDHVSFIGPVSDAALLEEFALADIFISASRYEGFGISAIEARAAGCRLLLHANDAFVSLFESDTAATLTDFTAGDSAGTALAGMLTTSAHSTIEATRRRTEAYSWVSKIDDWHRIYRSLCPNA